MTTLVVVLLLLALVALAAETFRMVAHDGRGSQPPPASHYQDPRFLPPSLH